MSTLNSATLALTPAMSDLGCPFGQRAPRSPPLAFAPPPRSRPPRRARDKVPFRSFRSLRGAPPSPLPHHSVAAGGRKGSTVRGPRLLRCARPMTRRRPWPPPGTGAPRRRRHEVARGARPEARRALRRGGRGPRSPAATCRCSARATAAATARRWPSGTSSSPWPSWGGTTTGGGGGAGRRRPGGGGRAAPRPPRDGPPPPARGGPARLPLQALPPRGAGPPLGLPSDAREHGPSGRGRAPPRAPGARGRPPRLAPRLRAPAAARISRPPRTSTRRARRSRGASPGCGRARRRTTASTASPSPPASTGGRSRCSAPTRSTSARSASA